MLLLLTGIESDSKPYPKFSSHLPCNNWLACRHTSARNAKMEPVLDSDWKPSLSSMNDIIHQMKASWYCSFNRLVLPIKKWQELQDREEGPQSIHFLSLAVRSISAHQQRQKHKRGIPVAPLALAETTSNTTVSEISHRRQHPCAF